MTRQLAIFGVVFGTTFALGLDAQQITNDAPQFVNGLNLVRPTYQQWTFIGAGLGMTYREPTAAPSAPLFGNIFVNPSSYRAFLDSGTWPNGTTLIVEARHSSSEDSINKGGRFQTDVVGIEAHVKDTRLPDGWGFFAFTPLKDVAPLLPTTAAIQGEGTCVECHVQHGAVDQTFVQFYPELLDVARTKGTIKAGF